jgi:uncharacterized protein (DUF1330 family)
MATVSVVHTGLPIGEKQAAYHHSRPFIQGENFMAKAYWVVSYRAIHKPEAFARYAAVAPAAVQANGGRFLVRGMAAKVYEAGIQQRVVVIEFDTLAQALAAHDTPAYQAALKELDGGAVERDLRIVEGIA